ILKSINEAEEKAAEIKAAAIEKAAEIAGNAEERSAEILKLSEAECKAYREKAIKEAEEAAQKNYDDEITVKRAAAAKYAAGCLKSTDNIVSDIVRRIVRGSC
ncbi:MAG: hypothetical protein K2K04_06965, partial [Clostridia bacterium]|nr:hypothetical protein [Clostridia bacterium]